MLWAVFTLNMLLVVLGIGRQHLWLEMRKVILPFHLNESPGSCSGSILYPVRVVPDVISYLDKVKDVDKLPIDIALVDYLDDRPHMKGFLVEGNYFRHVGYYSSLHRGAKDAVEFFDP